MSGRTKPRAPAGLGPQGSKVWRSVTSTYDLRADEIALLEHACREVDLIERLNEELEGEPLTVVGMGGAERTHPLLVEVRQRRQLLARILRGLDLPDADAGLATARATERSEQARQAALARWGKR